jgi:hypothetical protein
MALACAIIFEKTDFGGLKETEKLTHMLLEPITVAWIKCHLLTCCLQKS